MTKSKYPKYILRDGQYIGVFVRIDKMGFPIYRFPGGDSIATDFEIKNGSNNKWEVMK